MEVHVLDVAGAFLAQVADQNEGVLCAEAFASGVRVVEVLDDVVGDGSVDRVQHSAGVVWLTSTTDGLRADVSAWDEGDSSLGVVEVDG